MRRKLWPLAARSVQQTTAPASPPAGRWEGGSGIAQVGGTPRSGLPVPILVERQIEEQLAATRSGNGPHVHADALAFSFTSDHPYIGTLKGHVHAGLEIGIMLSGEIEVFFAETTFTCGPGSVWLCNAWEPHAWQVNIPGTINLAFIFLPDLLGDLSGGGPAFLELFTCPPEQRPQVTQPALQERVLSIACELRREMEEQPPFWQTKVRLDLLRILVELSRAQGTLAAPPADAAHDPLAAGSAQQTAVPGPVNRIVPAVKLAYESPSRRVTVGEAAAACALSPSRFHHLFRRTMGVSFGTFCLHARLAFVAHHLLYTNRSVGVIAEDAGFVDISHLCHVFGKHYRCTPGQYREQGHRSGITGSP